MPSNLRLFVNSVPPIRAMSVSDTSRCGGGLGRKDVLGHNHGLARHEGAHQLEVEVTGMKSLATLMGRPGAYRLWQSPFAGAKLEPFKQHCDLTSVHRVLDVGCGPGTNAALFAEVNYVGIDISPAYVEYARKRYGDRFYAADVRHDPLPDGEPFDCVLVNSLLHHIETAGVRPILGRLAERVTPDGHIHILDLVKPAGRSIASLLARWDRGDFPRPLEEWHELFEEHFEPEVFKSYPLPASGLTLWQMVYFKGRTRQ